MTAIGAQDHEEGGRMSADEPTREPTLRKFVSAGALCREANIPPMRAYFAGANGTLPAAAYVDRHPVYDPADPRVKAFVDRRGLSRGRS